jgi:V-type H+-transporting ATPase subunit E
VQEKQASVQKRIAYSHEYNGARLQVLKAQDECAQALVDRARVALSKIVADKDRYERLVRDLVLQALLVIKETDVKVMCRAADRELVGRALPLATEEYKKRTGLDVRVALEDRQSLPAAGLGGIVATALDGRIVCSNTVESRLQIAVEKRLPDIRRILFPIPLRKTPLATAVSL